MPTTIMAAPHAAMQDDNYIGFKIVRGVYMDTTTNPSPGILDPPQFEHELRSEFECVTARDPSQRRTYIFGAGRRMCQGMHIAERSLFLAVTRLLWAFDFKVSESGSLPDVDDLVGDLTVQPAPFEVRIVARSGEKKSLIQKTWTDVENMLLDGKGQWKNVPDGMAYSTCMPDVEERKQWCSFGCVVVSYRCFHRESPCSDGINKPIE
jgi:hypothetical protein